MKMILHVASNINRKTLYCVPLLNLKFADALRWNVAGKIFFVGLEFSPHFLWFWQGWNFVDTEGTSG